MRAELGGRERVFPILSAEGDESKEEGTAGGEGRKDHRAVFDCGEESAIRQKSQIYAIPKFLFVTLGE